MSKGVSISDFADKWSSQIEKRGYTMVPNILFEVAFDLGLTASQLVVLFVLIKHWWKKESEIFPSYAKLAVQAGTSDRTVARVIEQLESENYIRIMREPGRTNRYSLQPLVEFLDDIARGERTSRQNGTSNPRHYVMSPGDKMSYEKDSSARPP